MIIQISRFPKLILGGAGIALTLIMSTSSVSAQPVLSASGLPPAQYCSDPNAKVVACISYVGAGEVVGTGYSTTNGSPENPYIEICASMNHVCYRGSKGTSISVRKPPGDYYTEFSTADGIAVSPSVEIPTGG